jgi:tRNA-dihydrouridine synthase B
MAPGEMVTSDARLLSSEKTRLRLVDSHSDGPKVVQIAGACPDMLAEAAMTNVDRGADIIDINMGCPAKKVCRVAAGSALLKDEPLVARILERVAGAVTVPVTLKIRTGWDTQSRNAERVAMLAEQCGIAALTVHGRTRACAFSGRAEHDTTRRIRAQTTLPLVVNGDIADAREAKRVLNYTGADAVMIGRAAQGNPWIFAQINGYLTEGECLAAPTPVEVRDVLLEHLEGLYGLYGVDKGVRVARKHLSWYCKAWPGSDVFWTKVSRVESPEKQRAATWEFFTRLTADEVPKSCLAVSGTSDDNDTELAA